MGRTAATTARDTERADRRPALAAVIATATAATASSSPERVTTTATRTSRTSGAVDARRVRSVATASGLRTATTLIGRRPGTVVAVRAAAVTTSRRSRSAPAAVTAGPATSGDDVRDRRATLADVRTTATAATVDGSGVGCDETASRTVRPTAGTCRAGSSVAALAADVDVERRTARHIDGAFDQPTGGTGGISLRPASRRARYPHLDADRPRRDGDRLCCPGVRVAGDHRVSRSTTSECRPRTGSGCRSSSDKTPCPCRCGLRPGGRRSGCRRWRRRPWRTPRPS